MACKEAGMFYPQATLLAVAHQKRQAEELLIQKLSSLTQTRSAPARKLPCHYGNESKLQSACTMSSSFYTYPYVCFCSNKFATIQVDHFWCSIG